MNLARRLGLESAPLTLHTRLTVAECLARLSDCADHPSALPRRREFLAEMRNGAGKIWRRPVARQRGREMLHTSLYIRVAEGSGGTQIECQAAVDRSQTGFLILWTASAGLLGCVAAVRALLGLLGGGSPGHGHLWSPVVAAAMVAGGVYLLCSVLRVDAVERHLLMDFVQRTLETDPEPLR